MMRPKISTMIFALLGLTLLIAEFWKYHGFFADDAFISLRYCRNFLAGDGLVWNPGEYVEGYSNFLLVMMVSLLGRLGIDLMRAAQAVGMVSLVGLITYVAWYARKQFGLAEKDQYVGWLPLILTATSLSLVLWSVGGLESVLFSLFVTSGMLIGIEGERSVRRFAISGLLLALATLTRPDGGLLFLILLAYYFVYSTRDREIALKQLAAFAVAYLGLVLPHVIWQYSYYGHLVPNTWYVKGDFSFERAWLGCLYLFDWAVSPPYLLPFFVIALGYRFATRNWERSLTLLTLTAAIYLAYVISVGGDHMPGFRPVTAVIPLMAIATAIALRPLLTRLRARVAIAVPAAVLILCSLQMVIPGAAFEDSDRWDPAAYSGKIVGEYINDHWPAGTLVALNSAGATPYFAPRLRFIDMLGLNDTTIAHRNPYPHVSFYQLVPGHAKGDGRYVLNRKPDFIIAGPSNGSDVYRAWTLTEYEMARIFEFKDLYGLRTVSIPATRYGKFQQFEDTKSGSLTFTFYQRRPQ